jgi:predicted AlkP superfamily pyrophosphatase or phosphodiesterase
VTRRWWLAARLCALVFALALAAPSARGAADPILVLVSFDGWRWDYTDRPPARNLRALAARGVRVRELVPSFPTLTFPNHYTLVTGLYPDRHGIVANWMTDRMTGERFSMSSPAVRDPRWWGGEPIWVTAVRQGRRAAATFWPGSEADILDTRPTYWEPFDGKRPADIRVSGVLDLLALPDDRRPSFLTLYLDDVDHAGHDFGPDSAELMTALGTLDGALGRLVDGVDRLALADRVTLVVVSDHGMTALSEDRVIWLDDYVNVDDLDVTEWEGLLELTPKTGRVEEVYQRLRRAHPRLRVFTRETVPARLHYRQHARIPAIIGLPDDGWVVTTRARRQQRRDDGRPPPRGAHGFDPAYRSMHALFVAAGPEVRRGLVVPSIANVHVYDFLCAVLNLTPAPNDGDPAVARGFLRRPRNGPQGQR